MSALRTPPKVAPARRRLRSLVLPLVVSFLSLGLVVLTPTNVQASTVGELEKVVIAGGKKYLPAAAMGAARLNPWGLALTTAVWIGIETKDSWLPVVKGWFPHGGESLGQSTAPGTRCDFSFSDVRANQQSDGTPSPGYVSFTWHKACGGTPTGTIAFWLTGQLDAGGGAVSQVSGVQCSGSVSGSSGVKQCFLGTGVVQYVTIGLRPDYEGSMSWTPITWEAPWLGEDTETTTEIDCGKADGTVAGTVSSTITGTDEAIPSPSCQAAYPGTIPMHTVVKGGPEGGTKKVLLDQTTDPDVFNDYGDCFSELGLVCKVNVWIDGEVCRYGEARCFDWWGKSIAEPESVECKLGSYVIPMSDCKPLRRAYEKVVTVDRVDTAGDPITDPQTQTPAEPEPTTPTIPETGTNPVEPPTTIDPEVTDPDSQSCYGEMWGWNPVDWVLVPVKCALTWAFVPDPDAFGWDSFVAQVKARPPFSVILQLGDAVQGLADGYQAAGDCGVLADFGDGMEITCAQIKSIPGYSVLYGLVSAGLVGLTGFGMFHMVRRSLGGNE